MDFGPAANQALRQAMDLSRTFGAAVTVVHVLDVPSYAYSAMSFSAVDLMTPFEDTARQELEQTTRRVCGASGNATPLLKRGIAAEAILASIDETGADLVVMGTRGRHGVAHALLGSVAERLVRLSPVPVLTVRAPDDAKLGEDATGALGVAPIRKIVVPVDFGEVSEWALDETLTLASSLGAKGVIALHAQEYSLLGLEAIPGAGAPDLPQRLTRAAEDALRDSIERRRGQARDVLLEGALKQGIPWSQIVDFAARSNANAIVMGTHGRRGLTRAFLGSVAEKVVRYATVPVLTMHGPAVPPTKHVSSPDETAPHGR